ncbi:Tfp pilus assembly protein FimT/FimU [Geothrix sp. PMB-07]|uniref:pilus assembly FimT family protein n=1 Tax=Geothrix sp. PMB-07 TaxID=3068640 RepID=UPI0027428066|nr:prepilin-type N-terminal cleavage/methylation domain-containing protein [Geothrix sp. PMB-07]WLT32299.1 prepilin-type N-terminal cleavage/methylation domain-containing protein [Geothrix sp. PMB-07]
MSLDCRRTSQRGTSLLELTVVMALIALLAGVVTAAWDTGSTELAAAHQEIVGSLDQAFTLARARGTDVTVALGKASGAGEHLPVQLSRGVKWGKPAHIPLPPDMDADPLAARTGESHPLITVTPRHTTLASAWFVNNGKEALCMRLNGKGHLKVLRWRRELSKWTRV